MATKPTETVVIDENIVYEEDIEAAVEKLVQLFGNQGRVIYGDQTKVLPDMRVYAPRYGFLWYGDIKIADLPKLKQLAVQLNDPVYVVADRNCSKFYQSNKWMVGMVEDAEMVVDLDGVVFKYRYAEPSSI